MTWDEIIKLELPVNREAMQMGYRFAVEWTQGAAGLGVALTEVYGDIDQYTVTMLLCSH